MRTGGVPLAALLLVLASTVLQVSSAGDIYWEGEEDASNEYLEVKVEDASVVDHLKRLKRDGWNIIDFFTSKKPDATTEGTGPDDIPGDIRDDNDDGSGTPDKLEHEQREKTLRVTFVVMEPYEKQYSNRDSPEFLKISRSLANAVDLLYENLPGTQRSSLVRIQSLVHDDFVCKVTLDIVTTGYDNTDKIKDILLNRIKNSGRLGTTAVHDGDFSAQLIDPGFNQSTDDYDNPIDANEPSRPYEEDNTNDQDESEGSPDDNQDYDQTTASSTLPDVDPRNPDNTYDEQSTTEPPEEYVDNSQDTTEMPEPEPPQSPDDLTTKRNFIDNPEVTVCPSDHMLCDATRCVELYRRCDGINDCDDAADEAGCSTECGADDFRCSNNKCIESSRRCDHVYDCPDQEDERGCDCRPDEFRCESDGFCIEERKKCDGELHCNDGSDERDCACSPDFWQCDLGNCIRRKKRCDGRVDCPSDRSDERNCIANGYFRCRSGKIIPETLRCNRQYDCTPGDFSDEQNCPCGASDFKCDNGHCIPASKHCDRTHDCQDRSDERDCTYGTVCMAYEYECTSGMCVQADARCNGTAECDDGTDETSCPCKRDQYPCRDGSCINISYLCNGRADCSQGEDEYNCRTTCGPGRFTCNSGSRVACADKCNGIAECDSGEDEEDCEACAHKCDDGSCIPNSLICNRQEDCPDGSDEYQCNFCDKPDDYRCDSGECLPYSQLCNGIAECPDSSDELNCNQTMTTDLEHPCTSEQFQCISDRVCIDLNFFCDGNHDCEDLSDEANCPWYMMRASRWPGMVTCHESEFTCYDGRCIPHSRRCDNIYDCFDFSDEQNCYNTACAKDSWQCRNGECLSSSVYCDGIPDCEDGTDESDCPVTTTIMPVTPGRVYPTTPAYRPGGYPSGGCSERQWRCENGPCIDAFRRCDGHIDCPFDYSDEFDCPPNSPAALNIKTYPSEQTVRHGGDVVLQCRDEGPLRASVRWQKEGRRIKEGSTDVKGRLEMFKVTESDSGVYICQADSYVGYPGSQVRVSLHVENAPATIRPSFVACQPHQATCGNGQCIPKSAVCDNNYDCADRSDEENCHHDGMCEPNQFKCDNRKCVLKTWICDSENDCGDGSDELNCGRKERGRCSPVEHLCQSGDQCIPKSFHCDGETDCLDRSDEIGCISIHVTSPPKPSNVKLNPGDTLTLKCEAVGVPVPLISWRLNWGHVPQKCTWTSDRGIGIITCPNMQPEDSGAYSCEAINHRGTTFATPDAIVFVNKTDPCPRGYFNNEARSENECIRCFCFGKSSQCRSADLFTYNMPTPLGEGGTRLLGIQQAPTGDITIDTTPISNVYYYQPLKNGATVTKFGDISSWTNSHPYLTLPESYNGNQLKSYGGHIKYTVSPQTKVYRFDDNIPTIIIKGKYGNLFHMNNVGGSNDINVEARLTPEDWMKSSSAGFIPAAREDIMMTLDEIEMILLRADLNNAGVNITDFAMESADHINVGLGAASLVEECTCPKEYEGLSCQKCASGFSRKKVGPWLGDCVPEECPPGTYGNPSSGVPCKQCPCPLTNRDNQFARTCSLGYDGSVICDCLQGYEGKHCEVCAPGYEGNPLIPGDSCKRKVSDNCNPTGTKMIRPPDECVCRDNVQGRYCDQCKNDSFYLSTDFRHGCALCFCSGVSQQCMSSNLRRKTINAQFNVPQIVDQVKVYQSAPAGPASSVRYAAPVESDLRPELHRGDISLNDIDHTRSTVYYWSLPSSFAGDKVTSYGGYLHYMLKNVPSSDPRFRNNAADVQLISENRLTFHYFGDFAATHEGILNTSVQFLERGWQRQDGKEVSREHFLLALADVKTILIKATYSPNTQLASPVSASIEVAEADAFGPTAFHVEQCVCPPGYVGTSCEDCAPGFTRSSSGLYLEHCEPCECNGKSSMCNPETGICYDCADNTDGDQCESCKLGFERDVYGNCIEYRPSTIHPCRCDPRGTSRPCDETGECYCKQNVEGETCDRCRPGTFGLDAGNPDGCIACYCSRITSECHEGNHYTRVPIAAPVLGEDYGGFSITDLNAEKVIRDNFVPMFQQSELMYTFSFRPDVQLYWSVPIFPGNRVLSYGGTISLRQKFTSDVYSMSDRGTDVVLDGGDIAIYWTNPNQFPSGVPYSYQVPLKENGWYILNTAIEATRSDFMSVLSNLKRVLIRATVAPNIYETTIADVSMDTATQNYNSVLPSARGIEICMCPPGFTGSSCESCTPGYYKDSTGYCRQCACSGHECQLDSRGQVVCNCRPPFTGYDCSTVGDNQVTAPPPRPPPPEPTVVVRITSPTIKIQEVGSSVNFTCQAQSRNSRIRLPVRWSKSDGNLPLERTQVNQEFGQLLITNLQVSDSGKYICETSDGMNTAQAIATLKVPGNEMTLPTVEISPSVKEYYEGDRIELECRVKGNPTPTIRWQRASSRPLPMGAENVDTWFIIESARLEDAGEYRCIASNTVGSDDRTAVISIRPRPSWQPRDRLTVSIASPSVVEGQSIRVACTGTKNIPAGSIDWVRQDNAVFLPNVRSENGILYIDYAELDNQGIYICQAPLSDVAPVPVLMTVIPQNPVPEEFNITVSVDRLKIPTGGSGTVECNPIGNPAPLIKWTKHGGSFGPDSSQRGNTLIINNAQESDQGYYLCEGSVDNNPIANIYVFVEIERREPPRVDIWPQGEQAVPLGSEYELMCRVLGGIPEPDVTWNRNGGRPLSSFTELKPQNVLKFNKIEVNDEGEYTCTARNDAGSVSASAVIKVRSPPQITITPSSDVQVSNGEQVNVVCRANGYPQPMVSIQKADDFGDIVPASPGVAALHIQSASVRDDSYYTCTASSVAGTIKEQFAIIVYRGDGADDGGFDEGSGDESIDPGLNTGGPYETPSNLYVIEGQPRTIIECRQSGAGSVRWDRADRQPLQLNAIQDNSRLVIMNVSKSDSGQYVCNIYNEYGEVQEAVYTSLVVIRAPKITLRPPTQTVQPGQSPTVECIVDGDDIIDVTWRPYNKVPSSRVDLRSSALIFHQIEVEDAGKYECIARSQYANASAIAEVVVSEDTDHSASVSHDNTQHAHVGAAVQLSCNVSQPNLRIVWTKDGRTLPRSVKQKNDGSLFIRRAKKIDSGKYVCSIRDHYGRPLTSNYINLYIQGYECLETEFRCNDNSGCIDEHLLCDGRRHCQDNSDEYDCLWRDKRYSDSVWNKYLTHDGPREPSPESQRLVAIDKPRKQFRVGNNVDVRCKALSNDFKLQWLRLGTNEYVPSITYGDGVMLTLQGVAYADAGVYRCIGVDPRGRTYYDDFNLEVQSGSGYPSYPENRDVRVAEHTAHLRDSVNLPCTHDLEYPVAIEWRREFSPLPAEISSDQPNLHLESVTEADAGTYVCRVSNSRATVEARAILTVTGVVPRFDGNSFLSLPTLRDAYNKLKIEITFKPNDQNGLILYNSEKQGREGDYIALQMNDGIPEFIMNTGTEPLFVRGDRPLQLNTWHTIRLSRTKPKVTMDVDNTGPFIAESPQQWEVLELRQPLYIGGVPDYDQLPAALAGASGFIGCASMLILGMEEKNIMMDSLERYRVKECNSCAPNLCLNSGVCQEARSERGYMCICAPGFAGSDCDRTGEACRPGICGPGKCSDTVDGYKCACPVTHTGANCEVKQSIEYPAFTGSTYLAIKPPPPSRTLRMSIKIKAAAPVTDGIIIYCAESPRGYGGFTSLAVHNARLEFRYDLGGGSTPVVLVSNRTLPANEWTNVHVARVGSVVSMKINAVHSFEQRLESPKQDLNLDTAIYVGGVDDSITLNNNTGVTGGFNGCMKDFMLHGEAVDIVNSTLQSANVQECNNYDRGDIPEMESVCQCRNGGACATDSTTCSCPAGFAGQLCELRVPSSMRSFHQPPSDPCKLRPCRNGGTCRLDLTSRMNHTCDCPLGFSGVYCQMRLELYQSVGFNGNGYLELPSSLLQYDNLAGNPAILAFAIHTTQDGVLLYQTEAQGSPDYGDYILMRIEKGVVVLEWDLGGGKSLLSVDVFVNDGDRHQIIAKLLEDGHASLSVDSHQRFGTSTGINNIINADSNIYIGGIPDHINQQGYPGFNGCIEQLELMDSPRGLHLGNVAVAGRNTQRCKEPSRGY